MVLVSTKQKHRNTNVRLVNQRHSRYQDKINLGAFYTPQEYINIVWGKIIPFFKF